MKQHDITNKINENMKWHQNFFHNHVANNYLSQLQITQIEGNNKV